jgi:hypothetical protein
LVGFFARVELATFVDELAAGCAFHGERCHEADSLDARAGLLGASPPGDVPGVEVGRVEFL